MRYTKKNFMSLILAVLLLMGLITTAFANEPTITYKGTEAGFVTSTGSQYTDTDLFDNFKDVMPGDKLTQTIQIKNEAEDCNYINLYLKMIIHDENGNPLTYSELFENTDSKDQADIEGQRDETVVTMQDFLSKLTMHIYNGDELIYESSPDKVGALADHVLLGSLITGGALTLKAELDVPIELDNKYANRVGEVDWVFLAEAISYDKLTVHKVWEDNNYPDRPESVTVSLLRDGEIYEEVKLNADNQWTYTWDELDDRYKWTVEEKVLQGYEAAYETKDNQIFIVNHMDYVPEPEPEPETRELTVKKVWSDENNKKGVRPDAITVTLYKGKQAAEKITLNKSNNWTYTWDELDAAAEWSVLETGIPTGYTPSYETKGDVVTITNTSTLIQTGQLNWPIPVLGGLGVIMLGFGIVMMKKKREVNA